MLIAIIGVDGSGKTAVSKNVSEKLVSEGHKVKLLHVDSYFLFQPVLNLLNKKSGTDNKFLTTKHKPFMFKLWPLVVTLDNVVRYLYISALRLVGYTVVCDRFFYDKLLGLKYFGYTNVFTEKIYLAFTPTVKTIFLDISPEIAASRETGDSHTKDFFSKMVGFYKELALSRDFVNIDADKPINDVMEKVMKGVLYD